MPQGEPLSPLLSNILLADLDEQRAWPVVDRRRVPYEVWVRPHGVGFAAGYSAALLVGFMNRRMRNRTSAGVGGRRE
ncbi:MAG TPA: hypothetical protein VMU45_11510 [Candidatus Eisenbacteria bacterium]|nr:hypothetical protein [Candidatus Eisenbacteria bacterium]